MKALIRKAAHVLGDPILRRWLVRRAVGLEKSPPAFIAGQPPYLGSSLSEGAIADAAPGDIQAGQFAPPDGPVRIELPGRAVELAPENPSALFEQTYDDLETSLAAHRFAWVPIAGEECDPGLGRRFVAGLVDRFGTGDSGWPWHAYTAAERAINIIDFSRRFGWPGDPDDTVRCWCVTPRSSARIWNISAITIRRTICRITAAVCCALAPCWAGRNAETGAQIMVAEAGRIFGRSGMLREGSTHYHLLLTRNYIDAWLDAKSAGLEQAGMLRDIAERALAVIPGLCLPGGLPLIGDISPDVPPAYLAGLTGKLGGGDRQTWPAHLPVDRQRDVQNLIAANSAVSPDKLAEDGWHRFGDHGWQALAFISPDGWPPMPGHGHQDLGSFELHDGAIPVIVDPGRGTYADPGYESADMHNCLTIGGVGPVPVNRAYYSPDFRKRIVAAKPVVQRTRDGTILRDAGFKHLPGIGGVERELEFAAGVVRITDRVSGRGRRNIRHQFCTPHPVATDGDTAVIDAGATSYRLSSIAGFTLKEIMCWSAYGDGAPGMLIVSEHRGSLPYEAATTIERI